MNLAEEEVFRARVRGCLLAGAIGDALGAPIEFDSVAAIRAAHGSAGVTDFVPVGGEYGKVTDDTQMTLFTVDGLIRAGIRRDRGIGFNPVGPVHVAYLAWLTTQQRAEPEDGAGGFLLRERWLYARRAPGGTCLSALTARQGVLPYGVPADNDSKGCRAVMRAAPFGLLAPIYRDLPTIFAWSTNAGALTHGHPSGSLPAGALAVIVARLCLGDDLDAALDAAVGERGAYAGNGETTQALLAARRLAGEGSPSAERVEQLGGGWVGEEALAIGVYAALAYPGPSQMRDALLLAVNHSGDSDSTGAICGNILGAAHGETALPSDWLAEVEGRGTILQLADDFVLEFVHADELHGDYGPFTRWRNRY